MNSIIKNTQEVWLTGRIAWFSHESHEGLVIDDNTGEGYYMYNETIARGDLHNVPIKFTFYKNSLIEVVDSIRFIAQEIA